MAEGAGLKLDPKTSKHRLVACANCRAPVASSAWSGTVVLHCRKCGHEELREMSLDAPSAARREAPYRESAKPALTDGAAVVLDLEKAPEGRSAAKLDADVFAEALGTPDEWDRVWVAVWLAFRYASLGNPLDARVTLETALESVHTPAYRALLLAKLAQHSASIGAPGLAKKFLAARPDLEIPEIDSQVRAARALVAYVKGEIESVVSMTGDTMAGAGYRGNGAILAIALNIAANHQVGRGKIALAIAGDCERKGMFSGVIVTMQVFRISMAVITDAIRRMRRRAAIIAVCATGAVFAWLALGIGYPGERAAVAGAVAMIWSGGFSWWASLWSARATTKAGHARRKLLEFLGDALCVAIPLLWLVRTTPPPKPPSSADVPSSEEQFPPGSRVDLPPTIEPPMPSGVLVVPDDPAR